MANNLWRGDAPAIAQVQTLQVTANDVATTYAVTMSNRVVSTIGQASATATASRIGALLEYYQDFYPELDELSLTYGSSDTVTMAAAVAGVPFTLTTSVASGTGTATLVSVTANSGPNDWSVDANWSLGAVPVSTNNVYIDGTVDISYGLAQSAVTLASLNFSSTYTGKVGLPDINTNGAVPYYEYRDKYLSILATTINVSDQVLGGSGSGRIKLAPGANATTINVYGTGTPADSGRPALLINGSGSNYTLNILSGSVGIALDVATTATLPTVRVGYENAIASDVTLTLGSGCTITTISQYGGQITTSAGFTTWNMTAGTGTVLAAAAGTTLTLFPATGQTSEAFWESTGTITTLTVGPSGSIVFERDLRARTVTDSTFYGGCTMGDNFRTVTFSNTSSFKGNPFEMEIRRGVNYSMQL